MFAREVMDALSARDESLELLGVGGVQMAKRARLSNIDTSDLNVLGFWEGIKAYRSAVTISTAIAADVVATAPDLLVPVDAWGLNLRVAQRVRALNASIPIMKLIGPQVWASRAGRAKTLAATVDHLLCIQDFEVPYYDGLGLSTTVIGHPALSRSEKVSGDAFRAAHGLTSGRPLLLVLPGSRPSEIKRVGGTLLEAAKLLLVDRPGLQVCVAPASNVLPLFDASYADLPSDWLILRESTEHHEAMAAATAAISCSGTVNNELAVQQTPMVTGYRIGTISWLLMNNFLLKAPYVTLLNMAAGREIVPEFLQGRFTPGAIAAACAPLLDDIAARRAQVAAQDEALLSMGYGGQPAADIAAETILNFLENHQSM